MSGPKPSLDDPEAFARYKEQLFLNRLAMFTVALLAVLSIKLVLALVHHLCGA